MAQVLHGSATTTAAVRRAIQHSQESLSALAGRYGINQNTVAKWKHRTSVSDLPTGPKEPRSTVLSVEEVGACRRVSLSPDAGCANSLQGVCQLLPKQKYPYTLYALRDQYIANVKALSTSTPAAAAALTGDIHEGGVDSYRKTRQAWRDHEIGKIPVADPWLVSLMERRLSYRQQRNRGREIRRRANADPLQQSGAAPE